MRLSTKPRDRQQAAEPGPRRRVVVLDDDAFLRMLVARALPDATVCEAWRVEVARRMAPVSAPDAVIVDRRLPDGDGLDVVAELRHHPVVGDVPLVVLTAGYFENDRLTALTAGVDEYLDKMTHLDELAPRLDRLYALSGEERAARRQALTSLLAAGATGDLDPLPEPEEPQPERRRWLRRRAVAQM